MKLSCKNCGNSYTGKYCNHCGQAAETHEINWHFLWHDIQHGYFHFDKGIFFTIKELLSRPGLTIREFIDGKRVRHLKPITFVIFMATIYGFVQYFLGDNSIAMPQDIPKEVSEREKFVQIQKIFSWFADHPAVVTLFFLPIGSLGTYLAFRKNQKNYIQHIVLVSFLTGLNMFFLIVLKPIMHLLALHKDWANIPEYGFMFGYYFWTLYQFFDYLPIKKRIRKILVSLILVGIFLLITLILIAVLVGIYLSGVWAFNG